ncbi:50S ribosomal protein L11 methyltransferase [Sphingomonas sp. SUN039]|uniref:50S ribosomal protein L11 methyltransferase n=1 Tax=Sphingomonas sp. SUN039 TaxID=2937787 RepID=UPI00216417B2|nr:50S ribosomal protein L11 methyltransferase [Sphingomonas sp. SUN039]UVO54330.1 50S ribosomal protein L11 methyltransferase [Sphingomonas sp. SUN039]
MTETWKLTLPCNRADAERMSGELAELADLDPMPVIVASEPDAASPDRWQVDAYFEGKPSRDVLRRIAALVPSAREKEPRAKPLPAEDWVTLSQAGVEPLSVGRFYVRTPDYPPQAGAVDLVIPAGLAFGTGQHATTSGCLATLDAMKRRGKVFRNVLDLGTGTGLLAFAAARLWPMAQLTASDIDPVSIEVVRENAAVNRVKRLKMVVADALSHRDLVSRAPYDLVIANILAQPLIDMAPWVAASVAPGGTLILAGLLDTQAAAVARAYVDQNMRLVATGDGEWPVLTLVARPGWR